MDLPQLISALSNPQAYPNLVENVEVRQTHISVVFLAGEFVYKVKKPIALGFLNFSTLALRHHYCEEEVRLNSRLSPWVYLGVVPIVANGDGVTVEGAGPAIEWAVKMARLPDDATLERRLERGVLTATQIADLAHVVAGFHAQAERSPRIAQYGRLEGVAANPRGDLTEAEPDGGCTVHPNAP